MTCSTASISAKTSVSSASCISSPKGLRSSLYIKDDDYRLSFLPGNYVTLTNMKDDEWARVIEQKLSPYVSIHATDPVVRGRMLGRKGRNRFWACLAQLADAKIQIHGQVVLCPGYNDGVALEQTIDELAALHPEARGSYGGVLSVAVVPVGITQFRERLAALKTVDPAYAGSCWTGPRSGAAVPQTLRSRFVFFSDEFYLSAKRAVPPRGHYGLPAIGRRRRPGAPISGGCGAGGKVAAALRPDAALLHAGNGRATCRSDSRSGGYDEPG